MAVISISITESDEQIVAGIPKTISISTNIPATIFYTLDGSNPDLFSTIYVSAIKLPTNSASITLKIFATNGVDSSPIITEVYTTDMLDNTRLPHSNVNIPPGTNLPSLYPYGTNPNQPMGEFLSPGDASITVNDPTLTQYVSGYNADGYPGTFTNLPYTIENYSIKYSTTDSIGQTGTNIGNLPGDVTIDLETPPPEESFQYSNVFDPRAMVIFQDISQENPDDPPIINKQFFSLENPERARDGNYFYSSGLDMPVLSGSFLRSHYNPRDNTITYYYMDSWSNKWVISKTPYQPGGSSFDGNLSGFIASREPGSRYVFQWQNFARRVLF